MAVAVSPDASAPSAAVIASTDSWRRWVMNASISSPPVRRRTLSRRSLSEGAGKELRSATLVHADDSELRNDGSAAATMAARARSTTPLAVSDGAAPARTDGTCSTRFSPSWKNFRVG